MTIFIFQLHTDNRPAVLVHLPFHLLKHLVPIASYIRKIYLIIAPKLYALLSHCHHPIRESAISAFPMYPWAQPQKYLKPHLLAEFHISPQISAAFKIKYPLLFLMVKPDHIGGYNGYTPRLHLPQGFFPRFVVFITNLRRKFNIYEIRSRHVALRINF